MSTSPDAVRRSDMSGIVDQYEIINPVPDDSPTRGRSGSQTSRDRSFSLSLGFGRSQSPSDRSELNSSSPSAVRSRTNKVGRALRELVTRSDSFSSSTSRRVSTVSGPRPGKWITSSQDSTVRWSTPAYQSKNDDLHKLFRQLPPGALLIDDYSCALQRDILAHGRLYLTQDHLCFYANIFGWETLVTVRLSDVTAVTREKTAHVIPNALQVCVRPSVHTSLQQQVSESADTERSPPSRSTVPTQRSLPVGSDPPDEKYWFTSFVSRDTSYTVLMKVRGSCFALFFANDPALEDFLRHTCRPLLRHGCQVIKVFLWLCQ